MLRAGGAFLGVIVAVCALASPALADRGDPFPYRPVGADDPLSDNLLLNPGGEEPATACGGFGFVEIPCWRDGDGLFDDKPWAVAPLPPVSSLEAEHQSVVGNRAIASAGAPVIQTYKLTSQQRRQAQTGELRLRFSGVFGGPQSNVSSFGVTLGWNGINSLPQLELSPRVSHGANYLARFTVDDIVVPTTATELVVYLIPTIDPASQYHAWADDLSLRAYHRDITPPTATIAMAPPDPSNQTEVHAEFVGSEPNVSFRCHLQSDNSPPPSGVGEFFPCDGATRLFLGDDDHSHTLRTIGVDANGNVQPAATAAATTFTRNSTVPDTTIDAPPPETTAATSAQVAFSTQTTGAMFECRLDDGPWKVCSSPYAADGLAPGAHRLRIRARSAAGSVDRSPAEASWRVDPAVDAQPAGGTVGAPTSPPALAGVTPPAGFVGCFDGPAATNSCQSPAVEHPGLLPAGDVMVAPGGNRLYVAGGSGIAAYERDPVSGAVRPINGDGTCVTRDASMCTRASLTLDFIQDTVMSPDGRFIFVRTGFPLVWPGLAYADSGGGLSVVEIADDGGLVLRPELCIGDASNFHGAGAPGILESGCTDLSGRGLQSDLSGDAARYASELAVSPDGRHLYVLTSARFGAFSENGSRRERVDTIAVYAIGADGKLSQLPQTSGTAAATNCLRNTYFADSEDSAELEYIETRPSLQSCSDASRQAAGMIESRDFAIAPDGGAAYAVSPFSGAVLTFTRDASSGRLIQPRTGGCVRWTGWAGFPDHCNNTLPVVRKPQRVTVGEDVVLVAGHRQEDLSVFAKGTAIVGLRRNPGDGSLEPIAGMCLASAPVPDGCQALPTGFDARSVGVVEMALSEDRRTLYLPDPYRGAVFAFAVDQQAGTLGPSLGCVDDVDSTRFAVCGDNHTRGLPTNPFPFLDDSLFASARLNVAGGTLYFSGVQDAFTYRSGDAVVALRANRAPVCRDVAVQTKQGEAVDVRPSCSDPDGDPIEIRPVNAGGPLSADVTRYTPEASFSGRQRLDYVATDGSFTSLPAQVVADVEATPTPAGPGGPGGPGAPGGPATTPPVVKPPAVRPSLLGLPPTRRCVSRRRIRLKLRVPKGVKVVSLRLAVPGRKTRTIKGRKLRQTITLAGLPKGRFTVTATATLADGRKVRDKRRYRTCTPKRRR